MIILHFGAIVNYQTHRLLLQGGEFLCQVNKFLQQDLHCYFSFGYVEQAPHLIAVCAPLMYMDSKFREFAVILHCRLVYCDDFEVTHQATLL